MFSSQQQYFQKEAQKAKHKRLLGELTERLPKLDEENAAEKEEEAVEEEKKQFFVSSKSSFTMKEIGLELRNHRFELITEVDQREQEIDDLFGKLWEKSKARRPEFEKLLEREQVKEKLRLELARVATEFLLWIRDAIDRVDSDTHFEFTLEQVDSSTLTKELDESDEDLRNESNYRQQDYRKIIKKLLEYGQDTSYTTTEKELETAREKLDEVLQARRTRYNQELERQAYNDSVCQEFAILAEEFYNAILADIEKVTGGNENLDAQVERVEKMIWQGEEKQNTLQTLHDFSQKLLTLGVSNNSHTTLTHEDLVMQFTQFREFLAQKKNAIEDQIIVTKYRGVTADQIKEIDKGFSQYDINHDGYIDRKELKQCLYSLGEEVEMSEIEKIMEKYGDKDKISLPKFQELLISIYGDTGTREEILDSFQFLAKGEEELNPAIVQRILLGADREFFTASAPLSEKGYNYRDWINKIFSH